MKKPPVNKAIKKGKPQASLSRETKARKIMLGGVIGLSLMIFTFWGWSFKLRIDAFSLRQTPENKLISNTKDSWNEIFAETKEKKQKEIATQQFKNILAQIMTRESTDTIMPTTTPQDNQNNPNTKN